MTKKLLFITWDGPQTTYMQGLFMPIFPEVAKSMDIEFHIIQFSWADKNIVEEIRNTAKTFGLKYKHIPVLKKPMPTLGSLFTLFRSSEKIKKYIEEHRIDIVMPRSTLPALMVNQIKNKNFKIIFDADGLPIEERLDFGGLKSNGFQYKWMKAIETKMLNSADRVITRSEKAIDFHLKNIGEQDREKFSVVQNGRNDQVFRFDENLRDSMRRSLGIQSELLFVYAGSLGEQYCFSEMLKIFEHCVNLNDCKFLILTGNDEYARNQVPNHLKSHIKIKNVKIDEIPSYLNAADIGFALRQPSLSMQGVAPIKIGEYLLCGLPVIASKGIGDSEAILNEFEDCYLYNHQKEIATQLNEISVFTEKAMHADRTSIREKAVAHFSLHLTVTSYIQVIKSL